LRDLDRATDHHAGVVLIFEAVIPLHILTHDTALIGGLLDPEMAAVPRATHGAGVGYRRRSGRDQNRQAGVPRRVDGAAVVLRPDVDVDFGYSCVIMMSFGVGLPRALAFAIASCMNMISDPELKNM
jgi:hypothetical protein